MNHPFKILFSPLYKVNFICSVVLICSLTAGAQKSKGPVTLPGTYTYSLHSRFTGGDYEIMVSLPHVYKSNDSTRYPVLYILDGNTFMPMLTRMQQFFVDGEESIPMIIIGVGYPVQSLMASMPFRTRDYTPTHDPSFDSMLSKELHLNMESGHASSFLQTLSKEIIPFVERKYKVSADRAIAGHSFGALFGAYTLFHQPKLFNRYLLSSVSLPWDNGVLLKDEEIFLRTAPQELHARVFVSVGSLEGFHMIPMMKQMTKSLRDHAFIGLTIEEKIFENETHTSVVPTALNHGIRALYRKE